MSDNYSLDDVVTKLLDKNEQAEKLILSVKKEAEEVRIRLSAELIKLAEKVKMLEEENAWLKRNFPQR